MQSASTLLEAVEAFLARQSMKPVTFGRNALNDPHFVRQLRDGRRTWPETEQSVRDFMAQYDAEHPLAPAGVAPDPSLTPTVDSRPFTGTTEGQSLPEDISESDRPNGVAAAQQRLAA